MKQSDIFLAGEGQQWLNRNRDKLGTGTDPVLDAMEVFRIKPKSLLEVGAANGWRLDKIKNKYDCFVRGVDPARSRISETVIPGIASDLPLVDSQYDTIIYGWCLYLCDPEDYFRITAEGDRVLQDGGFIIIYDFCTDHPYKVKYKHKKGVYSHHYDFSKLWLGHPGYCLYGRTVQDETCVTILKKKMKTAFPVER